jgi:hypothetical protein
MTGSTERLSLLQALKMLSPIWLCIDSPQAVYPFEKQTASTNIEKRVGELAET